MRSTLLQDSEDAYSIPPSHQYCHMNPKRLERDPRGIIIRPFCSINCAQLSKKQLAVQTLGGWDSPLNYIRSSEVQSPPALKKLEEKNKMAQSS
jgi:hypothetical protein